MSEEKQDSEFSIPRQTIDSIYELSGDAERNKGLILTVISENGTPMIYSRFDSIVTELALKKYAADWTMLPDFDITQSPLD